jgi:hypothetical protein
VSWDAAIRSITPHVVKIETPTGYGTGFLAFSTSGAWVTLSGVFLALLMMQPSCATVPETERPKKTVRRRRRPARRRSGKKTNSSRFTILIGAAYGPQIIAVVYQPFRQKCMPLRLVGVRRPGKRERQANRNLECQLLSGPG